MPKSFWLGGVCDLVNVMVAIPWKRFLPSSKHLSDAGWAESSNGNASKTKANESFDNGVFFYIEAKRTPSIESKLFSKRSEHKIIFEAKRTRSIARQLF